MIVFSDQEQTINPTDDAKDIFALCRKFRFGELHFKQDDKTGLQAIVAIHSTTMGPSLGGCRFKHYDSSHDALLDVMNLSQSMSYKSALCGMPLGGGKAVILKPQGEFDRHALMSAFGEFVDSLGGQYITAMDSGSTEEDMNTIAQKTDYVASHSQPGGISGDPAFYTALGVYNGIKASVRFRLQRESLDGLHIALQGVGNVGYQMAKMLHADGARLSVSDIDVSRVQRCVDEFGAAAVDGSQILTLDCDVVAPCALGHVLTEHVISDLKAKVIAGCANNQLADYSLGKLLERHEICYAPDFVINSGGVIYAGGIHYGYDEQQTRDKIAQIGDRLNQIFIRSAQEHRGTAAIAVSMARELLANNHA